MSESALMQLAQAQQMLAAATTLPEIRQVRDLAAAAQEYARLAHLGRDAQNEAGTIKLEAEARAGSMLREMTERGERYRRSDARAGSRYLRAASTSLSLADLGLGDQQSFRWQQVARVPEATRQDYYDSVRGAEAAENEVVTRAGLLRFAEYYAVEDTYDTRRVDKVRKRQAKKDAKTPAQAAKDVTPPPPPAAEEDAYDYDLDDDAPVAPACTHCPVHCNGRT